MHSPSAGSRRSAVFFVAAPLAFAAVLPAAEPAPRIQPLDDTTVAVTDFTDAGRELPTPSPVHPVYYIGINAGLRLYAGPALAGEPPPDEKAMLRVMAQVLAQQGFLAADTTHSPTQVVVCSWGVIGSSGNSLTGPGTGIHFLGGDKLDLIDQNIISGHIDWGDVLRQRFRTGTADTVLGLSHETLYAVLIRAYDLAAARDGRIVQLWETRLACASPGNSLAKSLPRLIVSGQHAIGRETATPVVENAARTRQAWVEIGETTVVEYINVADLEKAKEEARKQQSLPEPDAKETQPKQP